VCASSFSSTDENKDIDPLWKCVVKCVSLWDSKPQPDRHHIKTYQTLLEHIENKRINDHNKEILQYIRVHFCSESSFDHFQFHIESEYENLPCISQTDPEDLTNKIKHNTAFNLLS